MGRLVVLTTAALADGFRLAGCPTVVSAPGAPCRAALSRLAAEGDVGLLLVTADLWASVGERERTRLEAGVSPVVTPIPAGVATEGEAPGQLLGEMLQRAIGYRIELTGSGQP
jgi:vacuolar-type H+-ATPase subunit F/Vma7